MPAGSALGYNQNWRYRHTGGELLMMTASGEPSAYYPMDSNGLAVQNAPAQPCICAVVAPAQTAACPPLGYGGCEGGRCGETPMPPALPNPLPQLPFLPDPRDPFLPQPVYHTMRGSDRAKRQTSILICTRPVHGTGGVLWHSLIAACGKIFEVPAGSTPKLSDPGVRCAVYSVTEHEKRCICSQGDNLQHNWPYNSLFANCHDFVVEVLDRCLLDGFTDRDLRRLIYPLQ